MAVDIDPSLIGPDTYIRLDVAARLAFPDGSIGISCLRGEAKRGRLVVWRVGNKDMTTLTEVAKMVDLCRVQPNPLDSGSARRRTTERPSGSSLTADANMGTGCAADAREEAEGRLELEERRVATAKVGGATLGCGQDEGKPAGLERPVWLVRVPLCLRHGTAPV